MTLLEPYWETRHASLVLHALRLWGPDAPFPSKSPYPVPAGVKALGPRELLQFFLDESVFQRGYRFAPPLFFRSPHGVGVRSARISGSLAHQDDFLALAGEVGLPLDTRFHWGKTSFALEDLIRHSCAYFGPGQELEFTAVAFAYYLPPTTAWVNRFGQRFNFDLLAEQLVKKDLRGAACYGTHVPYALAVLLAVDEQVPILSEAVRRQVEGRLKHFSRELVEYQGAAGWWDHNWTKERRGTATFESPETEWIRSTGHHLEWIALVKPELRPPDQIVRRAVRFLLPGLRHIRRGYLSEGLDFNPYSHGARALVLMSGKRYAAEVMRDSWARQASETAGGK